MRNVTTWAMWACLCASLLVTTGCLDLDFGDNSWWGGDADDDTAEADQPADDQPLADQLVADPETPEQLTIRTQREQIDLLEAENTQLKDDIIFLASEANRLEVDVADLKFAMDQRGDGESLDDAIAQRDRHMELAEKLATENDQLAQQVALLKEDNADLESHVATLNERYDQLLEALGEPSTDDDDAASDDASADDGDVADDANADDSGDDDGSRINFGG